MLNSRDVSEWAVRHVRQVFDEWCRQTEQEEEERQRSESDADE